MDKMRLRVDKLGRVTLPILCRRTLGIQTETYVDVYMDDNKIEIPKVTVPEIDNGLEAIVKAAENSKTLSTEEYGNLVDAIAKLREEIGGLNTK